MDIFNFNASAAALGCPTEDPQPPTLSTALRVGLKPTVGLVSRSGIVPLSHSQDTAGPLTRSVRDAAVMLGVMAGLDPSLTELIRFNATHAADEMPLFQQELLLQAEAKGSLEEGGYRDARSTCLNVTRAGGIDAVLSEHRLDAIVSLTQGRAVADRYGQR
jgi:Asp-tRNA(Asn)/Glu-tRNA(Gln) amidotransferase A subunit family amidase